MYFYFNFDTYEMYNKVSQPKNYRYLEIWEGRYFCIHFVLQKKIRDSFDMLNNLNKMGNYYRLHANQL